MRPPALRTVLGAALLLLLAVPTASAEVGPDYVSSDNVTLTARIKTVGDGVGGRIVGDYLYVTSTKSLSIFDIKKNPANPEPVGVLTLDVEFENEEVPTNGKILGISAQNGCRDPLGVLEGTPRPPSGGAGNCLNLYDVREPANVKFIKSIPGAGQHTSACVLDCQWFYGDDGSITDARDWKSAKLIEGENFIRNAGAKTSCHAVREIAPGIILGSCQPIVLWSVRPEHGGSITKPAVLAVARNEDNRFIHSNRWPRLGTDRFALIGGEEVATGTCSDQSAAFMVWDATGALDPSGGFKRGGTFNLLDEVRPRAGTYGDGKSPYNALGCSVQWFQEQPAFRNGGLVALAEYEQGTRFLQITPAGKIIEQGYFLPLGGSASSPLWNPDGKHVYNIDYTRGIDVLEWKGATYRGGADPFNPGSAQQEPGSAPGTNGARDEAAIAALKAREAKMENCTPAARTAGATASGRRLRLNVPAARSYDAAIFRVSKGRTVLRSKRVARFRNKSGETTWRAGRKHGNGYYVVRFTTSDGRREIAVRLAGRRFRSAPPFSDSGCGIIRSYALDGPVFGGRTKRALGVNFQLTQNADQVVVEVLKRGELSRKVTRKSVNAGQVIRLKLRGKGITRGDLQVRLTALRGGTRIASSTLAARGI